MSGTQDLNVSALISENDLQADWTGANQNLSVQEADNKDCEDELSPSQKMDALLRRNSTGQMKKEIEKLRKEAAKYRNSTRVETQKKLEIQAKVQEIQEELDSLKLEHRNLSVIQKLDKAGCVKSELVAKDVPADISTGEDLDAFIENYREENKFLFKTPKQNAGGSFKTSGKKNLTPSQQMDAYIRAALGR